MNSIDNKKLLTIVGGVVVLIVLAYLLIPLNLVKNLWFIGSINEHPALHSMTIIAAGEIVSMNENGFVIVAGENDDIDTFTVYVHPETSVASSLAVSDIAAATSYSESGLAVGDTVNIAGSIFDGKYWANNISLIVY